MTTIPIHSQANYDVMADIRYCFHTRGAAAATLLAADYLRASAISCSQYLQLCKWSEGREGMGPVADR